MRQPLRVPPAPGTSPRLPLPAIQSFGLGVGDTIVTCRAQAQSRHRARCREWPPRPASALLRSHRRHRPAVGHLLRRVEFTDIGAGHERTSGGTDDDGFHAGVGESHAHADPRYTDAHGLRHSALTGGLSTVMTAMPVADLKADELGSSNGTNRLEESKLHATLYGRSPRDRLDPALDISGKARGQVECFWWTCVACG